MLKVCLYCDRTEALHSRINLNLTGKRKKEKKTPPGYFAEYP